jgi:hypothetical protein
VAGQWQLFSQVTMKETRWMSFQFPAYRWKLGNFFAFFKELDIIKETHTGKIVCVINCNEGKLSNIKIASEIHA